jgi:transcriptional regulator with GAF, ATPase, and Fis domain
MHKEGIGLSRGALERLKNYNWPGNVRELKNCITRAVAMVESDIIQTEDIRLEEPFDQVPVAIIESPLLPQVFIPNRDIVIPTDSFKLNRRQQIAFPTILQKGSISRLEYQRLIGEDIPVRTAQYDLQDLVKRGVLIKSGNGPATRYYPAKQV